jgi:uncharacterized protein
MHKQTWRHWLETSFTGAVGGSLFFLLDFPLPWLLGAFFGASLWKFFTGRQLIFPAAVRNTGFILLGIYFAFYLSVEALLSILPLLPVFIPAASGLVLISLLIGLLLSRKLALHKKTAVLSSVPGAQSAVVLLSEKEQADTSLIVILHSVRKIILLFTLPFVLLFFLPEPSSSVSIKDLQGGTDEGSYLWYLLPAAAACFGFLSRTLLLAAPAAVMAGTVLAGAAVPPPPAAVIDAGQLLVGLYLGSKIDTSGLKAGGRFAVIYGFTALILILTSALTGLLLAELTPLDPVTAILSLAPGGLLETAIIAAEYGGEPSIVLMLQFARFLLVFYALPPLLTWYFSH